MLTSRVVGSSRSGRVDRRQVERVPRRPRGGADDSSAQVAPGSDEHRQARDRADRHPASLAVAHADQRADRLWAGRRVGAGELHDLVLGETRERGHALGRIFGQTRAELLEPDCVTLDVLGVVQPFGHDHVHEAQRQGCVRAGPRPNVPVGRSRGPRLDRVDHDDAGTVLPRLGDERPQVQVRDDRVRPPEHDETAVPEVLREHPLRPALRCGVARRRGRAADPAPQPCGSDP